MTEKQEMNAEYYDHAFAERPQYGLTVDAQNSWHSDLYAFVIGLLNQKEAIFELGCGTGQFAEQLLKEEYNYVIGIDFSKVGVKMSIERCGEYFIVQDAYNLEPKDYVYFQTVLSLEVMEHLENDLLVLSKIPKGKRVIFSVPNFDDAAHVRHFRNKDEVEQRYKHLFTMFTVHEVNRYFVIECVV